MKSNELGDRFASDGKKLVARARVILRNQWDAEDAVQDAFVRALRYQASLRAASDAGPWLRTIVQRCSLDLARRRDRTVREAVNDGLPAVASAEDTFLGVVDNAVLDAVRSRTLLADLLIRGYSCAELAAVSGVPPSTLRTRYRRLKRLVRRELAASTRT